MIAKIIDFITWWTWRRWNIYCPPRISEPKLGEKLFDYDENFISPCSFNPINSGAVNPHKATPKISFLGFELDER